MIPVKESSSKGEFLKRMVPVKESSSKGEFLKRMVSPLLELSFTGTIVFRYLFLQLFLGSNFEMKTKQKKWFPAIFRYFQVFSDIFKYIFRYVSLIFEYIWLYLHYYVINSIKKQWNLYNSKDLEKTI